MLKINSEIRKFLYSSNSKTIKPVVRILMSNATNNLVNIVILYFVFQTARNICTTICRSLNGSSSSASNQRVRGIYWYTMYERKDLRTRGKKWDTWSRTQKELVRKMFDDENRHTESKEKEFEERRKGVEESKK